MIYARLERVDGEPVHVVAATEEILREYTDNGQNFQRTKCSGYRLIPKRKMPRLRLPLLAEGIKAIRRGEEFFILW